MPSYRHAIFGPALVLLLTIEEFLPGAQCSYFYGYNNSYTSGVYELTSYTTIDGSSVSFKGQGSNQVMAKSSQLSQLKTALNKAGLTPQQQQNGKKRKRAVLDDKEKERRAAKLREIQQKMNPFDVKVTKLKHDVGGRKIAGIMGRPAQSKQAGIEQVHN